MAIDTPVFELRETLMGKYGEDSKLIYDLADVFYYYLNPEPLPTFPDRHGKRPAHMVALGRTAAQAPGGGADKRAKTRGGQTPGRAASSLSTCSASSAASSRRAARPRPR